MKKKLVIISICIVIISSIIFRLVYNKKKIEENIQLAQVENVHIPVIIAPVTKETQKISIVKTGVFTPFKEAKILSVSSGNVQRLLFKLGDNVRERQILAIIDTHILELDLKRMEFNIAKLKRDLQTYTELLEGKAATQEKVNEIEQNYIDALNQAQQLRRQISDAAIKSPLNGIINTKSIEQGMYVAAGTEIATVINLAQLKVQVNLTESEAYQVSMGQKIKLHTDVYPDKTFEGEVSFVSPSANEAFNYPVEIVVNNENDYPLKSGTFVSVDFSRQTTHDVLLIPKEALNETSDQTTVYIVENGKAKLKNIKVGSSYKDKVYVLQGLKVGDMVITSGQINLTDGSLINISK